MNNDKIPYIINYFSHLMTHDEKLALKYKIFNANASENAKMRSMMIEKGWINASPEVVNFLENSCEKFELDIVKRILTETPEKVFFNNCPKCNKLARTPYAKQCRFCSYSWHHLTVAQFKLENVFQLTDRGFYLIGEIVTGNINKDCFMDLSMLINKKIKIEEIEFATKNNSMLWNGIGLKTSDITEENKLFLKQKCLSNPIFDIVIT